MYNYYYNYVLSACICCSYTPSTHIMLQVCNNNIIYNYFYFTDVFFFFSNNAFYNKIAEKKAKNIHLV